jgi:hypothetical protein
MGDLESNSENLRSKIQEVLKLVEVYGTQRAILFGAMYKLLSIQDLDSNTVKAVMYDAYNTILESGLIMDDNIEKDISKKVLESILTNSFINPNLN